MASYHFHLTQVKRSRGQSVMLYGEDDAVAWSRFLIENC